MKKVNEVFFGKHGQTSTSANHLANIAQEKIVSNEAKLKNLNFVTTTVDIVGSPENSGKVINKGYDETRLSEVRGLLSELDRRRQTRFHSCRINSFRHHKEYPQTLLPSANVYHSLPSRILAVADRHLAFTLRVPILTQGQALH